MRKEPASDERRKVFGEFAIFNQSALEREDYVCVRESEQSEKMSE